jgi:hypothetical protein
MRETTKVGCSAAVIAVTRRAAVIGDLHSKFE